ncbi:MAG: PEP-CTERM sorting domain-containing protein [Candidatus Omnitrophica bacterium]|nr:PEP-CTERM sorting domain-containing protein [Candidatus Omnitrophota bacterium]MBU4488369.1 PEP-CTERM sorting domain-containing protein [Candidatus Omnitrophota bacterium]MCG2704881.1 PEP-CTERM sorting domain-containing protein [Candidatus Omnitrophota bacterium]
MKKSLFCLMLIASLILLNTEASAYLPDFGFEGGNWGGWASQGSENAVLGLDVFPKDDDSSMTVLPYYGSYMARVNSYDGESDLYPPDAPFYVFNNFITQTFEWGGEDMSFWYNYFTWDYGEWDEGQFYPYDDPGFSVWLDGSEIWSWSASSLDDEGGIDNAVDSTGWQQFTFTADNFRGLYYEEGSEIALWIYAGNTGDDEVPSWVYIDGERNVIPEPMTMSLLGLGILGLAGFRRKK